MPLFGTSGTGEIIASPTDPNQAFYLWLFEPSSSTTCTFSQANGHRWLILKSTSAVGAGVSVPSGYSVGDFGPGVAPAKIPSGSHYPRQSASVDVWANWFDTAGPTTARVNVDGTCTPMTLGRGTMQNGAYKATLTNVATGCHRYYFEFKDSSNQAVTYPTTGSLGIGAAGTCPDWEVARPATCDAPPQFVLSVVLAGSGGGAVTSGPVGISCGMDCGELFNAGTMVTLTAMPAGGSLFNGWSGGGCSGNGTCVVTVNAATSVTATFTAITVPDAPIILSATPGNGQVSVSFSPPAFDGGSPVTGYTAQCAGAQTASNTGAGSPVTVTGMINGQSYSCGVIASNVIGDSPVSGRILVTPNTGTPLALLGVKSRKIHFAPPPFDLPIDYTVPVGSKVTVEPRNIGAGHAIVFQFNSTISSTGIVSAIDTVSGAITGVLAISAGSEIIVTLPGVPDKRRVTVSLTNVNGAGVNAAATIGFLVGDVNSTGVVNASDIAGVKARSLQSANTDNFKFDLDTSGTINATDVSAAKARSGRVLP
ncbi:MAG: fibronectin type III domain-containing protein [Betaproteobacteria bacterium]|nr:fibronectin type III domain-containing protein [Betaproteobacteria bacterium]